MIIKTQPCILKKRLNITYFDDAEFKKIVNIYIPILNLMSEHKHKGLSK